MHFIRKIAERVCEIESIALLLYIIRKIAERVCEIESVSDILPLCMFEIIVKATETS